MWSVALGRGIRVGLELFGWNPGANLQEGLQSKRNNLQFKQNGSETELFGAFHQKAPKKIPKEETGQPLEVTSVWDLTSHNSWSFPRPVFSQGENPG